MMDSFDNIESLVRRIVQSVNGAGSDSQTPNRNATPTSNANAPAEGSELNPEEELYSRFNIPRAVSSAARTQSAITATSTITTASAVAQRFNPQTNYGYTGRARRQRAAALPSRPYTRTQGRGRGRGASPSARTRVDPPSLKEVILLPKPSINTVPKYAVKAELHKKGFIMDLVPIDRSWNESQMRAKIEELFANVLCVNGVIIG